MGQYFCVNLIFVKGKCLLEFGIGIGYVVILCVKYFGVEYVIVLDGFEDVVNNFLDNFFINGFQGIDRVFVFEFRWGYVLLGIEEEEWNGGREVDVVFGVDIMYDVSVIFVLVVMLQNFVVILFGVVILIVVIEWNRVIFESFLEVCQKCGFYVYYELFLVLFRLEQRGLFYNDVIFIYIC